MQSINIYLNVTKHLIEETYTKSNLVLISFDRARDLAKRMKMGRVRIHNIYVVALISVLLIATTKPAAAGGFPDECVALRCCCLTLHFIWCTCPAPRSVIRKQTHVCPDHRVVWGSDPHSTSLQRQAAVSPPCVDLKITARLLWLVLQHHSLQWLVTQPTARLQLHLISQHPQRQQAIAAKAQNLQPFRLPSQM